MRDCVVSGVGGRLRVIVVVACSSCVVVVVVVVACEVAEEKRTMEGMARGGRMAVALVAGQAASGALNKRLLMISDSGVYYNCLRRGNRELA